MYERHYSAYRYADGRHRALFVGPGDKVVLRTRDACALWVWRRFLDDSGQEGINCAVFRNEGAHQSSLLIRQADEIADCLWPDRRHYTYVNPEKVRSTNPGFCFLQAGWRRCGHTARGLLVMERPPPELFRDPHTGPQPIVVNLDDPDPKATLTECFARVGGSQAHFARLMGVSYSSLSEWLRGIYPTPMVAVRAALFAAQLSGIPIRMPNPSQYLSRTDKRVANK